MFDVSLPERRVEIRVVDTGQAGIRLAALSVNMLELYQAEGCPYSEKARQKLSDIGVSYTIHNPRTHEGETLNEQTHDELVTLGGEDQIPFLVDHQREVTMYESDDIVDYLDEHYA